MLDEEDGNAVVGPPRGKQGFALVKCRVHRNTSKHNQTDASFDEAYSTMSTPASFYHRHRLSAEIISHCVWLYFRFSLSFRDVEEMLAIGGVSLTYATVRDWCLKFGQTYVNFISRRQPRAGDCLHLDEVFLNINGRIH